MKKLTFLLTLLFPVIFGKKDTEVCEFEEEIWHRIDWQNECDGCFTHGGENKPECKNWTSLNPLTPLTECSFLPEEFIICNPPKQRVEPTNGNSTTNSTVGCLRFGGQKWEDVEKTSVCCRALDCIECKGKRTFLRDGYPCIKYSNHYFLTTLLYSVLLGFLGLDRFCLGQTAAGVVKLLTLGGFGMLWIIDICGLIKGGNNPNSDFSIRPADGSNWIPYA